MTASNDTSQSNVQSLANRRVRDESSPPRVWQLPVEIRRRLSNRGGRQRAIVAEDHLVMVLHTVPQRHLPRQSGVYFWRNPAGEWSHSEQGAGFSALSQLINDYENLVVDLEAANDEAASTKQWFDILDSIGPVCRAARNLHETLVQAREATSNMEFRDQLQPLCDQASEIERSAELLQVDVQNSIHYAMVRQSELQSGFSRAQSVAAHRLNILAAIFLPMATLSSIFGMNLASGLEGTPPAIFWLLTAGGIALGIGIGVFVMQMRGVKPEEW